MEETWKNENIDVAHGNVDFFPLNFLYMIFNP